MIAVGRQNLALKTNECQQIVLRYEALTHQIAGLLASHSGFTSNLSEDDFVTYRQLAQQRDWAYDQRQRLEYELLYEPFV